MRYLYLFILLLSSNGGYSQSSYYKDIITDRVTVNYPDHTVITFVKPLKRKLIPRNDREYFWYSANSIQSTQGGFSGKPLNGFYSDYYLNKNLREQGYFNSGLKTGTWKSWFANGRLNSILKWNSGQMNGRFARFDEKGSLKETGRYSNGVLTGKLKSYTTKDSITIIRYKDGKAVSKARKKILPNFIKKFYRNSREKEKTAR